MKLYEIMKTLKKDNQSEIDKEISMKEVMNNRIIPFLKSPECRKAHYESLSEKEWKALFEKEIIDLKQEDFMDGHAGIEAQMILFSQNYVINNPEKALILAGIQGGYDKEQIIDHLPDLFTQRVDGAFECWPYESGEEAGGSFTGPDYVIFPEKLGDEIFHWFDGTEAIELMSTDQINPVLSQLAIGKDRIVLTLTNLFD